MYTVSHIYRVVCCGWSEVDHCFVEWFVDSGTDHILGGALQFSSVLPVSKGYRPCGSVCSLSSCYCQKHTVQRTYNCGC
jgi:hypothetical protein